MFCVFTLMFGLGTGCGSEGRGSLTSNVPESGTEAGSLTVHVPSAGAPGNGIAVRIFYPASAVVRYPEGAPVAIFAPGGTGPGDLPPDEKNSNLYSEASSSGFILMYFLLPGGSSENISSGGIYDYRGPACKRSLADVIKYALGKTADTDGRLLKDRLPFALNENVGVIGSSNGGNLAITTFAEYGAEFPELAWFAAWETPIAVQNIAIELSAPGGILNPYYEPGTCAVTDCPWPGLADALSYDPVAQFRLDDPASEVRQQARGIFFIDGNERNGKFDTGEFFFSPIGGPGQAIDGVYEPCGYVSEELADAISSQSERLFSTAPRPSWLPDTEKIRNFWAERDASLVISRAHAALPNILVMDIASIVDHVQMQPDHPHVRSFIRGWIEAGHSFVRLNPDASYMAKAAGKGESWFPDNDANALVPYSETDATIINDVLEPEFVDDAAISQSMLTAAAFFELSDRSRSKNYSPNLNALLYK